MVVACCLCSENGSASVFLTLETHSSCDVADTFNHENFIISDARASRAI